MCSNVQYQNNFGQTCGSCGIHKYHRYRCNLLDSAGHVQPSVQPSKINHFPTPGLQRARTLTRHPTAWHLLQPHSVYSTVEYSTGSLGLIQYAAENQSLRVKWLIATHSVERAYCTVQYPGHVPYNAVMVIAIIQMASKTSYSVHDYVLDITVRSDTAQNVQYYAKTLRAVNSFYSYSFTPDVL